MAAPGGSAESKLLRHAVSDVLVHFDDIKMCFNSPLYKDLRNVELIRTLDLTIQSVTIRGTHHQLYQLSQGRGFSMAATLLKVIIALFMKPGTYALAVNVATCASAAAALWAAAKNVIHTSLRRLRHRHY